MSDTILIAYSNPVVIALLSSQLGEFNLLTAGNGEEAMVLIREHHVDLIIIDLVMPGMEGITLCRQVKEELGTRHIFTLLLTAKNNLRLKIDGLKAGADMYIEKPFDPDYLVSQAKNLLRNKKVWEYFRGGKF